MGSVAQGPGRALRRSRFQPNDFGLAEALGGLAVGFVLASVLVALFATASGHSSHPSSFGSDVVDLLGLWAGLVGAAVVASRRHRRPATAPDAGARRLGGALGDLAADFGLAFRPWPDLPLGVAVGLGSQYLLVPLLELPLSPFVPHLAHRLSQPARSVTGDAHGPGLLLIAVLVCLGSPLVEELFFRGLLLRALAARLAPLGRRLGPAASVVAVGIVFGLVHFEALELPALVGFGMVLALLAWRTGRLGAGIVAHMAFNTATVVSLAHWR